MADDTAFDDWLSEGRRLAARSFRLQWEVGDWWTSGEPYGDRVNEGALLFADLYTYGALRNLGSIAARVAPAQRCTAVPFWTHSVVARLEPANQDRYLKLAEAEHLTARQLAERVNDDANRARVSETPEEQGKDAAEAEAAEAQWADTNRAEREATAQHRELNKLIEEAGLIGGWDSADGRYVVWAPPVFTNCDGRALREFLESDVPAQLLEASEAIRQGAGRVIAGRRETPH